MEYGVSRSVTYTGTRPVRDLLKISTINNTTYPSSVPEALVKVTIHLTGLLLFSSVGGWWLDSVMVLLPALEMPTFPGAPGPGSSKFPVAMFPPSSTVQFGTARLGTGSSSQAFPVVTVPFPGGWGKTDSVSL